MYSRNNSIFKLRRQYFSSMGDFINCVSNKTWNGKECELNTNRQRIGTVLNYNALQDMVVELILMEKLLLLLYTDNIFVSSLSGIKFCVYVCVRAKEGLLRLNKKEECRKRKRGFLCSQNVSQFFKKTEAVIKRVKTQAHLQTYSRHTWDHVVKNMWMTVSINKAPETRKVICWWI